MRRTFVRHPLFILTSALLILLGILVLIKNISHEPEFNVSVSTHTLPTLLPHAHGAGNKISDVLHGIPLTSEPFEVPETFWITSLTLTAEHAPTTIVHHLTISRMNEDGTFVPDTWGIYTFGQDTPTRITFPAPAGILVQKGEKLGIEAVLHNPIPPYGPGEVYKDVTVTVTLEGEAPNAKRYVPLAFSLPRVTDSVIEGDDDAAFTVPPHTKEFTRTSAQNPEHIRTSSHTFRKDGWIVYLGAHMHAWEGGEQVQALLNGKVVKTFYAHLTDPNMPWSFETDGGTLLKRIQAGDVLSVSATYSNSGDEPVIGAMGMLGLFYTEDTPASHLPPYVWKWRTLGFLYGLLGHVGIRVP